MITNVARRREFRRQECLDVNFRNILIKKAFHTSIYLWLYSPCGHWPLPTHRINAHRDIHNLSGIRAHDPSVPAGNEGSCLRQRSHCDRPFHISMLIKLPFSLDVLMFSSEVGRLYWGLEISWDFSSTKILLQNMQNIFFWGVAPCGSGFIRRFRGTYRLLLFL
jgi:hypothetical protein